MTLEEFLESIPDFAVDIKLNAKTLLASQALSKSLAQMIFLGCAFASKSKQLFQIFQEAFTELGETEKTASKIAGIIMNMNNIYYRFTHLVENKEYSSMRAGLRMNGLAKHGIEKKDFELISLAISALNGCGMCMDSHEKTAIKEGVAPIAIQEAVKIAAIINSLAILVE